MQLTFFLVDQHGLDFFFFFFLLSVMRIRFVVGTQGCVTNVIGDSWKCDQFRIAKFIFPRKEIFGI